MKIFTFEVIEYGERYASTVSIKAVNECQAYALVAQDYPLHIAIDRVA